MPHPTLHYPTVECIKCPPKRRCPAESGERSVAAVILALWATLLPLLQHPGMVRLWAKGFRDFRRRALIGFRMGQVVQGSIKKVFDTKGLGLESAVFKLL